MTSPVAIAFAQRIAPRLITELEERKDDLIAGAGAWPTRQAAKLAFPAALKAVHPLTESGADAMLDEFGSLTLADVASRLIAHQTAKGRPAHASLYVHPLERISMLPHEHEELCRDCCADVVAAIDDPSRDHGTRRVVGAAFAFPSISAELIEAAVKNSVDLLVKYAGPSLTSGAINLKPEVRQVVSQSALVWLDSIVHGWMDAKTS